jgi:hypothetical protein
MEKIGFINSEVNAEIIRGLLETFEIKASIAPWGSNKRAMGGSQAIFVEAGKEKEALEILAEKGFAVFQD